MFKIDSPGATGGNEFTEGNPALNIPATEVSDEWLNAVQRELVEVVEFGGLVLDKLDDKQVRKAIQAIIQLGGDQQLKQTIPNNEAADTDIVGLLFDKADFKAARIDFDLERFTDASNVQETGIMWAVHDTKDDIWLLRLFTQGDDAGVDFDITVAGQIRHIQTTDIAGANYDGDIRISSILKFNQ